MAKIEPLKGKYYGTVVSLESGEGITIWIMGDNVPSDRQLAHWGVTYDEAKEDDYLCDNHYETQTSLRIASELVGVLNKAGL